MKTFSIQILLLALLLAGCKTNTEPKNFNLVFRIESLSAYKISMEIKDDKTYSINQQNKYFDSFAGKARPNTAQGRLTDGEFAELTNLLAQSPLFKMKDNYGFDEKNSPNDPYDGLIYYLTYTEGDKTKFITIQPNGAHSYPGKFPQLIKFLSDYTSRHLQK